MKKETKKAPKKKVKKSKTRMVIVNGSEKIEVTYPDGTKIIRAY